MADENRQPDANGTADSGSELPDFSIKHPLERQWTLWFDSQKTKGNWSEAVRSVCTVSTIEEFWWYVPSIAWQNIAFTREFISTRLFSLNASAHHVLLRNIFHDAQDVTSITPLLLIHVVRFGSSMLWVPVISLIFCCVQLVQQHPFSVHA